MHVAIKKRVDVHVRCLLCLPFLFSLRWCASHRHKSPRQPSSAAAIIYTELVHLQRRVKFIFNYPCCVSSRAKNVHPCRFENCILYWVCGPRCRFITCNIIIHPPRLARTKSIKEMLGAAQVKKYIYTNKRV